MKKVKAESKASKSPFVSILHSLPPAQTDKKNRPKRVVENEDTSV